MEYNIYKAVTKKTLIFLKKKKIKEKVSWTPKKFLDFFQFIFFKKNTT